MDIQTIVHYSLHFGFPFLIAYLFFRENWKYAGLIMVLMILIDVDHLLASPVFDPQRCSIGFHPLHSFWAIGIYFIAAFFKKTRIIAIGLLIHIFADLTDCLWTFSKCRQCYMDSKIHEIFSDINFSLTDNLFWFNI
ncbi:MAG: DUF6122 family protein [Bacteroidales bacterium]